MATLRGSMRQFGGLDSHENDIVELVALWLQSPEVRDSIYENLFKETGRMLPNIVDGLVDLARR